MGESKKQDPHRIVGEAFDKAPKLEMGIYWGSGCYPSPPFTNKQWREINRRRRAYYEGRMDSDGNIISRREFKKRQKAEKKAAKAAAKDTGKRSSWSRLFGK